MKNRRYNHNSKKNRRASLQHKRKMMFSFIIMLLTVNIIFGVNTLVINAKDNSEPLYKYYQSYMVEKGDTLLSIAYDLNEDTCSEKQIKECVNEMISINSLDHKGTICYGNYIIVPYYSAEYR